MHSPVAAFEQTGCGSIEVRQEGDGNSDGGLSPLVIAGIAAAAVGAGLVLRGDENGGGNTASAPALSAPGGR